MSTRKSKRQQMEIAHWASRLWQSYCAIKAHLEVLTKVVLEKNASASLAFAAQTKGIIDDNSPELPKDCAAQKVYRIPYNVGKTKYVVSFHDGLQIHEDGSPFFEMRGFSNKVKFNDFVASLEKQGYREKQIQIT